MDHTSEIECIDLLHTFKAESEVWIPMNKLLKQHGLKPIEIAEPSRLMHSNDIIGISRDNSACLRDNLSILMKDGDRRQTLIQDLILSNNRLRSDLENARTTENSAINTTDELKDLKDELQSANSRIMELETLLEQQAEMNLESTERDNSTKLAAQARVKQLETRCELHEEEVCRLREKVKRLNEEQTHKEQRVRDIFSELKRGRGRGNSTADTRLIDVIDTYETEITKLNKRVALLSTNNHNNNNDDGDEVESQTVENSHRYKTLIKSFNKDLRNIEKENGKLQERLELLELELQARPQLESYNKQKQQIRQLERLLQEHSINIYSKDAFDREKYSTKVEDIDFLPLKQCRKYLNRVVSSLELGDLEELEQRLETQRMAYEGFPKLEELIYLIADVVEPKLTRDHKSKHKVWCSKHWKAVIPKLELWRQQSQQIPELCSVVIRLLEQISQPDVALKADCTVPQIIKAVERVTSAAPSVPRDKEPRDDSVSHSLLLSIVRHFQHLFDVSSISGVFPRMNEVYTRFNESKNVLRTIAEMLDLGASYKGSDVVDAVGRICRSYTSSTYKQLKQLLQEDELDSVIERLEEHRQFVPLFRDIIDQLMDLLDVSRIDQVVPAVRAIKLMIS